MKVCGIIAEYNPFHSGHAYQIGQARAKSGCDYVIAVMSGDFVQRGAPALTDKYSRAREALYGGADLVLMLPVYGSTASAEGFARAGVAALLGAGVVDAISFGCEDVRVCSDNYRYLARALAHESGEFQAALTRYLSCGIPYAQARVKAVKQCYGEAFDLSLLDTPNNLLAFEYVRALEYFGAALELAPGRRLGSYHDGSCETVSQTTPFADSGDARPLTGAPANSSAENTRLTDEPTLQNAHLPIAADTRFASASACRRSLLSDSEQQLRLLENTQQIPTEVCRLLADYAANYTFLQEDDLSQLLHYALLAAKASGYEHFLDCGSDLSTRIGNQLEQYRDFSGFCDLLKNKSVTRARVARALTHILLQLPAKMPVPLVSEHGTLPYLRVLGFRKSASPLLHEIKLRVKAPFITRVPEAGRLLSAEAMSYFSQDLFASGMYRSALLHKCGSCFPDDYRRRIEIV